MTNQQKKKEVLLVSLEFVQPLFSGNGILAQGVVRGLLHLDYKVTVLCARPSNFNSNSAEDKIPITIENVDSNNNHPEERMDDNQLLTVVAVDVPSSTWKKLDRNSCYEYLANGAMEQMLKKKTTNTNYDYVFAIDWSAIPTVDILKQHQVISPSSIFVYLVFRVFSSSKELCSSNDDFMFYVTRELDAIQKADVTFVLSHVDKKKLLGIQKEYYHSNDNGQQPQQHEKESIVVDGGKSIVKDLHVHVPPLRNDFYHKCQKLKNDISVLPSASKYILCNVRLSPEKNALLFANIMQTLSKEGTLEKFNLIPIMIGSICDKDYAQKVYAALPSETVVINKFLCSEELIKILSQTILMIHPPTYDAFGMTVSEAAAVGVPSIIHHENIGASSLFRVEEGEILYGDMNFHHKVSDCVRDHLESLDKLALVSEKARKRAMGWNVNEYAQGLESAIIDHTTADNNNE